MYEMNIEIPFTRTGADGLLRLPDAVGLMMDCCQFQEYQEAEFCRFLRENNIAIFLLSIQIDILRFPRFREQVRSRVKIYGCKSIYGLRSLTIHDHAGNLCMIANATGAFVDLKNQKAIKFNPADLPIKFDEAEKMECLSRKIPIPPGGGSMDADWRVTPSVVDYNGHLTSHVYFALASDSLPEDFCFNRVRMEYKKQAKINDVITPEVFLTGSTAVVNMLNKHGESLATAEFSTADIAAHIG